MELESFQSIEQKQFEGLIEGMLSNGFGSCDEFLDEKQISGLRNRLLAIDPEELKDAGTGKASQYKKEKSIRGDKIHWLDEKTKDPFELIYLDKINRFILYLNQTCYTAINANEFHYAKYPIGSFYKKHLDQFKSNNGRIFSIVLYLNDNWLDSDAGEIGLHFPDNIKMIPPLGGRLLFFKSDEQEHEVFPSSTRSRLSLTGWLKSINSSTII